MPAVSIWSADPNATEARLPYLSNPADIQELGDYIAALLCIMGLSDWRIILMPEPPNRNADAYAEVRPIFGQRVATLMFAPDMRSWNSEKLRRVLCHELTHCHLDRMDTAYNGVADELGTQARNIADRNWTSNLEDATDNIACAWCELLPTIEWPEREAPCLTLA